MSTNESPVDRFEAAARRMEQIEAFAILDPYVSRELAQEAASDIQLEAGDIICDTLRKQGFTDDQLEHVTSERLWELVPQEMQRIAEATGKLGLLARNAINDQIYKTDYQLGLTQND